jgi:hypothetical protein
MKHIINCCPYRAVLMIKRYNNVAKKFSTAVEACTRKDLINSSTGQFIHWNQEIKFPDDINDLRSNPELFDEKTSRRRPDIRYYIKVKRGTPKSSI